MSVHLDDVFVAGSPETLESIKELIKLKFNIQESGKVKKFIGVYYEWVHGYKVLEEKITMKKDVKKLVDGYKKYTERGVKVQKTPGSTGMTLCKIKLKEPTDIEN